MWPKSVAGYAGCNTIIYIFAHSRVGPGSHSENGTQLTIVLGYMHILVNDQLGALFLNVFISYLYMFRATSAHHQEGQIVLIHHLV
jgi:hypothetical protein